MEQEMVKRRNRNLTAKLPGMDTSREIGPQDASSNTHGAVFWSGT